MTSYIYLVDHGACHHQRLPWRWERRYTNGTTERATINGCHDDENGDIHKAPWSAPPSTVAMTMGTAIHTRQYQQLTKMIDVTLTIGFLNLLNCFVWDLREILFSMTSIPPRVVTFWQHPCPREYIGRCSFVWFLLKLYYITILYYYTILIYYITILYCYTILLYYITILYYDTILLYYITILYYYTILRYYITILY